jgi:hypothetical protein
MTVAPGPFETLRDSPVIIDSSIGGALNDYAIRRDAGSGPDKDYVAHVQPRERNRLNFRTAYPFGSVRKQCG